MIAQVVRTKFIESSERCQLSVVCARPTEMFPQTLRLLILSSALVQRWQRLGQRIPSTHLVIQNPQLQWEMRYLTQLLPGSSSLLMFTP